MVTNSFRPKTNLNRVRNGNVSALGMLPFPKTLSVSVLPGEDSADLQIVSGPDPGPSYPYTLLEQIGSLGVHSYSLTIVPRPMSSARGAG